MLPLSKVENKTKATRLVALNAPKLSVYGSVYVSPDDRRDVVELEWKLSIESKILQVLHLNTKTKRLIIMPDVFCIACRQESTESFIEDQAFSPSYDFAHFPLHPPSPSRQSSTSDTQED
jgi:hypothetical protein